MGTKNYQYRTLAYHILENCLNYEWSLQGFGMLRFYVTQDIRIHVWDDRFRIGDVSGVHTHPWHFDSTVLLGKIKQYRFTEEVKGGKIFDKYVIKAGEGGGLEGNPSKVLLARSPLEIYPAGSSYHQSGDEIHLSLPDRGTVTIVFRRLVDERYPDHAFVYVPDGEAWVSAEPRKASSDEVKQICDHALARAFPWRGTVNSRDEP